MARSILFFCDFNIPITMDNCVMGLYFADGSLNLKQSIVKMPGFVTSRLSREEAPTINNIYYQSIPFS